MIYKLLPRHEYLGQVNQKPSATVPDQTMSIRTILEKYARGENFNQKVPIYSDDDNMGLDIKKLDISEIHDLKMQNAQEIQRLQDELGSKRKQKADKERDQSIQLAAKRLMEENAKRSQETPPTTNPI